MAKSTAGLYAWLVDSAGENATDPTAGQAHGRRWGNRDANLAARIDRSARSTERDCGATSDAAPSRRSLISSTRHICAAQLVLRRAYRDKECLSHSPFSAILIARALSSAARVAFEIEALPREPSLRDALTWSALPYSRRFAAATRCNWDRAYVSATNSRAPEGQQESDLKKRCSSDHQPVGLRCYPTPSVEMVSRNVTCLRAPTRHLSPASVQEVNSAAK